MSPAGWQGYLEERAGHLVWGAVAVWTVLVGASLLWDLHQARKAALELARTEAQLSYEKDLAFRPWSAESVCLKCHAAQGYKVGDSHSHGYH